MREIDQIILDNIEYIYIPCPACEYMSDDEQYTCTECWCQGGNGRINVLKWIKENPKVIQNK